MRRVGNNFVVSGEATATKPSSFSGILNRGNTPLKVFAEATVPIRNISTSMVLDVSWSMRGHHLSKLKEAVKEFGEVLWDMPSAYTSRFNMNMVPFSGSVNLSAVRRAPDLVANWQYQTQFNKSIHHKKTYIDGAGCTDHYARQTMNLSGSRVHINEYRKEYHYDEEGKRYERCTHKGTVSSFGWQGCIQTTGSSFSPNTSPRNGSLRLLPPTKQIERNFNHCPPSSSALRTRIGSESQYRSLAQGLDIGFATAHDVGILWGYRTLAPNWSSFLGVPSRPWKDDDYPKYLLFLTDGKPVPIGYDLGDSRGESGATIQNRAVSLCNYLTSQDVTIIGVSYGTTKSSGALDVIKGCVEEENIYHAASSDLEEVFTRIAQTIVRQGVRLSR